MIPDHYIEKIRTVHPRLSLDHLEFNQDGMNNDVVIVNQQLVCRFAKTDWAKEDLKNEVKVLQVARQFVDLTIPHLEHVEDGFVIYPFIQGEALSRHQLFRLNALTQEKVIEQLGQFCQQLHSIPSMDLVWRTAPEHRATISSHWQFSKRYSASWSIVVKRSLYPWLRVAFKLQTYPQSRCIISSWSRVVTMVSTGSRR